MKCCSLAETARGWNVARSCSLRLRGVDDGVAARGKKLDRRRRATVDRQVDQHLADDGGELEPVPRKAGAERNMLVVRMPIDQKVAIRRERVHADARSLRGRIDVRQAFLQELAQMIAVGGLHRSI